MHFRKVLSGTLAIMLLSASAQANGLNAFSAMPAGFSNPLPKLFGGEKKQPQVQLAQTGDPRITALEEQVRSLSGTIEELNFQILQMQEQMRKMQEDNEFRFQELEQKKSGAVKTEGAKPHAEAAPALGKPPASEEAAGEQQSAPSTVEEVIIDDGSGNPGITLKNDQTNSTTGQMDASSQPGASTPPPAAAQAGGTGAPPSTFGTITFDEKGNVTGGSVGDQITRAPAAPIDAAPQSAPETKTAAAPKTQVAQSDDTVVAALPATGDPEELYRNSYEFILSGDYATAETGFRDHINRFPGDPKTADARFWLGESLLGQKKYRDAAEVFLSTNKEFPSAKKAPDMLLKLGVSLVGLNQRDVACATFSEIGKRYPDISGALKERVKQEQALAAC